jgi:ABC transporter fused permease/ATP-binding protein
MPQSDVNFATTRNVRTALGSLLGLARPEWLRLFAGCLCLLIGNAASLIFPQGIRLVVDAASNGSLSHTVDQVSTWMIVISLIFGFSMAGSSILVGVAGERIAANLRQRLFGAILKQEIEFFDVRRTGELMSRLSSDSSTINTAITTNLAMALRSLTSAAGGIAFLLFTSPVLTALMLAVVPATSLSAWISGRRIRRLSREVQDALAAASEVAEDAIAGVRTVRTFDGEEREVGRYSQFVDRAFQMAKRRIVVGASFTAAASFGSYTAVVVVFWYGGHLLSEGKMTVGALTSFLVYAMTVAVAVGGLGDLWADLMRALGAAERIFEIIDRQPSMPAVRGRLPTAEGKVELCAVHFAYPTRPDVVVLAGVDLVLEPGEVVAVVGPSGAGKSTITALISRFYDPLSGNVLLDGQDIRHLDPRWVRRQVGVVAQEPVLFSTSIAENIRYGRPDASRDEVEAATRAANVHGFVSALPLGYETSIGERGVQLSGGQRQRIAIARALLKDPRVLILDEATSALDAESEHLVQEALERLMRGRTSIIIAHRLSTVIAADRVIVMDAGRIVQSGSHTRLLGEEGLYRRLLERQSGIQIR